MHDHLSTQEDKLQKNEQQAHSPALFLQAPRAKPIVPVEDPELEKRVSKLEEQFDKLKPMAARLDKLESHIAELKALIAQTQQSVEEKKVESSSPRP